MSIFVLGNGVSRQKVDIEWLKRRGKVYACNAVYRTHAVDVLVATDQPIATDIQASGYSKQHTFYTRRPTNGTGALKVPKEYHGYSSGPAAVALASERNDPDIYLIGFDMGPNQQGQFNNMYAGTTHYKTIESAPTFTGNWAKQICSICAKFADKRYTRVVGETTAPIKEFELLNNMSHLDLDTFLQQLNSKKD